MPEWIAPELATLTEDYFSDPQWIFERKLDGVRLIAFKQGPEVKLYSRNRILQNNAYPEIAQALVEQPGRDLILDGEVVSFADKQTSFSRLSGRFGLTSSEAALATGIDIDYYVFDVLHVDGLNTRELPQLDRKLLLQSLLHYDDRIVYTEHRAGQGEKYLKAACKAGWEGLIAKRTAAPYQPGIRSRDWLKFKCSLGQEFIIGGYTEPEGSRVGFGALLLGYLDPDKKLRYAGKVGTGFDTRELKELTAAMQKIERRSTAFIDPAATRQRRSVHWVKPVMVCQVAFTEWTPDGHLRHPRYLGLRKDKPAREVVREEPKHV